MFWPETRSLCLSRFQHVLSYVDEFLVYDTDGSLGSLAVSAEPKLTYHGHFPHRIAASLGEAALLLNGTVTRGSLMEEVSMNHCIMIVKQYARWAISQKNVDEFLWVRGAETSGLAAALAEQLRPLDPQRQALVAESARAHSYIFS